MSTSAGGAVPKLPLLPGAWCLLAADCELVSSAIGNLPAGRREQLI